MMANLRHCDLQRDQRRPAPPAALFRVRPLRQGIRLLGIGLLVGFAGAFALSLVIRSLLFSVSAADPAVYLAVSLLLGGAAMLACWIPPRRAARVDPIITLRAE
jgi:putative ABC transport system permease protein